jgi:hypothetical protein
MDERAGSFSGGFNFNKRASASGSSGGRNSGGRRE